MTNFRELNQLPAFVLGYDKGKEVYRQLFASTYDANKEAYMLSLTGGVILAIDKVVMINETGIFEL